MGFKALPAAYRAQEDLVRRRQVREDCDGQRVDAHQAHAGACSQPARAVGGERRVRVVKCGLLHQAPAAKAGQGLWGGMRHTHTS